MAMTDMNVMDDDDGPMMSGGDSCPCIYLTDAQVKALGITTPPAAGSMMTITAMAVAQSVTQSVDGDPDDPDICMSLKLTHMSIGSSPGASKNVYDD